MSWHYLRELEGESLQDICSGGELLQPLKSKITHAEFYCNGKLMDSYLDSLFGTTFAHSMASLGEEESMLSLVDSHAKICQQQEKAKGLTESDQDSGGKWQGSFAKYNPDTHSLRTHQCLLFEDSTEFCAILPKWGLMLNGVCWEQQTLVQTISVIVYGLNPNEMTHPPPPHLHLDYTDSTYEQRNKRTQRASKKYAYVDCSSEPEMAYSDSMRELQPQGSERNEWRRSGNSGAEMAHTRRKRTQISLKWQQPTKQFADGPSWWQTEPRLDRVAHGVASRMDRLKAIGNGQVPLCAATAWRLLNDF
jgi:hypothetical protein